MTLESASRAVGRLRPPQKEAVGAIQWHSASGLCHADAVEQPRQQRHRVASPARRRCANKRVRLRTSVCARRVVSCRVVRTLVSGAVRSREMRDLCGIDAQRALPTVHLTDPVVHPPERKEKEKGEQQSERNKMTMRGQHGAAGGRPHGKESSTPPEPCIWQSPAPLPAPSRAAARPRPAASPDAGVLLVSYHAASVGG